MTWPAHSRVVQTRTEFRDFNVRPRVLSKRNRPKYEQTTRSRLRFENPMNRAVILTTVLATVLRGTEHVFTVTRKVLVFETERVFFFSVCTIFFFCGFHFFLISFFFPRKTENSRQFAKRASNYFEFSHVVIVYISIDFDEFWAKYKDLRVLNYWSKFAMKPQIFSLGV